MKRSPKGPKAGASDGLTEVEQWEVAGAHCSANERRADEASRDVEAWLKCRFMREHLGEEFGGTVSAVTTFGLFVQLDGLYVEGLVHITELGGEYFRFDEVRQELRGERSGVRYVVGARVRVQVSRVDLDGRKIDFRMVREGEDAALGSRTPQRARKNQRSERQNDGRPASAVVELEAVIETDREVKAHTKAVKAKSVGGRGAHASRSAKTSAKVSPRSTAGKSTGPARKKR